MYDFTKHKIDFEKITTRYNLMYRLLTSIPGLLDEIKAQRNCINILRERIDKLEKYNLEHL